MDCAVRWGLDPRCFCGVGENIAFSKYLKTGSEAGRPGSSPLPRIRFLPTGLGRLQDLVAPPVRIGPRRPPPPSGSCHHPSRPLLCHWMKGPGVLVRRGCDVELSPRQSSTSEWPSINTGFPAPLDSSDCKGNCGSRSRSVSRDAGGVLRWALQRRTQVYLSGACVTLGAARARVKDWVLRACVKDWVLYAHASRIGCCTRMRQGLGAVHACVKDWVLYAHASGIGCCTRMRQGLGAVRACVKDWVLYAHASRTGCCTRTRQGLGAVRACVKDWVLRACVKDWVLRACVKDWVLYAHASRIGCCTRMRQGLVVPCTSTHHRPCVTAQAKETACVRLRKRHKRVRYFCELVSRAQLLRAPVSRALA